MVHAARPAVAEAASLKRCLTRVVHKLGELGSTKPRSASRDYAINLLYHLPALQPSASEMRDALKH